MSSYRQDIGTIRMTGPSANFVDLQDNKKPSLAEIELLSLKKHRENKEHLQPEKPQIDSTPCSNFTHAVVKSRVDTHPSK